MTQNLMPSFLLNEVAVLKVSGADAESYLQGQLTNDVTDLETNSAQFTCQCDSKGKVWSIFYLIRTETNYLIVGDASALQQSLSELKKYAVFSKVEIEDASTAFHVVGSVGSNEAKHLHFPDAPLAVSIDGSNIHLRTIDDKPRTLHFLSKDEANNDFASNLPLGDESWRCEDIQAGIPNVSALQSQEFIPQMMNLQALNAISFSKGCYMGQETVARTKYLGKNKRAGFVLFSDTRTALEPGELLENQIGENWRRAGTILSSSRDESGTWIFAILPNDLDPANQLRLKSQPDVVFHVKPLPYELDSE